VGINSTFCGGEPVWANACVGNNGNPDYYDYAKGYSSAANLLIKTVLDGGGLTYSVDQFVYPICFNMRHSVELRLKGACGSLKKLSEYRGTLEKFDLRGSHDIGGIWDYIKRMSTGIDERFLFFIDFLDKRILDLAEIDATGQTFRYPDDSDNVKHLVEVSLINIKNLSRRFSELEYILDCFEYFCDEIVREYGYKTFTTKLSRPQLRQIRLRLPARATWGDDSFKALAVEIKNEYGLSNNDFSRALCKLKEHYASGSKMEPPPLVYIDEAGVFSFFDAWFELNSIEVLCRGSKPEEIDLADVASLEGIFGEIKERAKKEHDIWPKIEGVFSVEWLADLKALYELSGSKYSEEYVRLVNMEHRSLLCEVEGGESTFKYSLFKLLGRPGAVGRILKSLYFLGYGDFAEVLIDKYGLSESFSWLEKARVDELFYEPYRASWIRCAEVLALDFEKKDD
jgi:hypothetical protein